MKISHNAHAIWRTSILLSVLTVVSSTTSSNSRPPFCLSSIINDLEAEGVPSGVATATLLSSKSVSPATRTSLLKNLISFGLSEEDKVSTLEEVEEDVTSVGRMIDGVGVAFAAAETPSEAASTVMACGKTIVYLCSKLDLERGEGLFDTLAPAMEAVLKNALPSSTPSVEPTEHVEEPSTLIVVLPCAASDSAAMNDLRTKFEKEVIAMLPNLASTDATDLNTIFKQIIYLPQDAAKDILEKMCTGSSMLRDPSNASAAVATVAKATFTLDSLFMGIAADVKQLSAEELAAARTLLPIQRSAFETGLAAVRTRATKEGTGGTQLVVNFGELCDAALQSALEAFDTAASPQSSALAKRIRNELQEYLSAEYEMLYEQQLVELKVAMFEKFRRDLSGLKVSPNLAKAMEEVMGDAVKEFSTFVKKLQASSVSTSWSSLGSAAKADFKRSVKGYCTDRLQAAKASGMYRPVPRKAITVGLHWLLPRPFGSDNRQAPEEREYRRNFIYHPGRAEVSPEDVKEGSGAWRSKIVPTPAGSDMLY